MTLAIWSPETQVRTGSDARTSVYEPTITTLPTGGYVVGWRESDQLKFKIYDGLGNTTGTIYSVNAGVGVQSAFEIHAIGNEGGFAVSWNVGGPNGGARALNVRVFSPEGTPGVVTNLTASTGDSQFLAAMAQGQNGGFVSTYKDNGQIRFSIHDSNGAIVRTLHVNADTPGRQSTFQMWLASRIRNISCVIRRVATRTIE
ncbi:hypothetical protein [Microvirga sp. BSC39]|uniref:hypothetical protein n=1 Tax=Microvirga sp. BSC39 TaxID=1549810 RepID=UPI00126A1C47|nr:hypothetical protein [Microvirga sp. BSC39]